MDVAALERRLVESMGFVSTPDYRQADQIIFFACADTQDLENNSRRLIDLLQARKRPDAGLIVTGCLTRIRPELQLNQTQHPELIQAIEDIISFGQEAWRWTTHHQYRPTDPIQVELFQDSRPRVQADMNRPLSTAIGESWPVRAARGFILYPWKKYTSLVQKRAFRFWRDPDTCCIKISTGCCHNCAFCSIRQSRGSVRSKPIDTVLQEFEVGLKNGHTKFVLLGTNTGDYGLDYGYGLVDLLDRMLKFPGKFEVALRNVNPAYVIATTPRLAELARTGHITLLHSAIQTGSDRLLKLMRRDTRIEDFTKAIHLILRASPKISIMTQIMVGFPGENEEDFAATLDLLRRIPFNYVETFRYTDRPNTVAANMAERPDAAVVDRRVRKIKLRNFTHLPINRLIKRVRFGRGQSL